MSTWQKACWLVIALIALLILTSCATYQPMEQATSIEDYCKAVYAECRRFQKGKDQGADRMDVAFYIAGIVNQEKRMCPEKVDKMDREFDRMKWAADQIFLGRTPLDIERECIVRRNDGTWF